MKKMVPVLVIVVGVSISSWIRFLMIRRVLQRIKKPADKRRQTILAAVLTVLTAGPDIDRQMKLVAKLEKEAVA